MGQVTELVGELIATVPDSQDAPTQAQAAAAVNLLVTGNRSKVMLSNAQAVGGGDASIHAAPAATNEDPGWWTG